MQIVGRARPAGGPLGSRAKTAFLARHPAAAERVARAAGERLYVLAIDALKITDNRRGFGWKCTLRPGDQPPKTSNRCGT